MTRLLIDENPLQVLPGLAVAIGLNEAIVLQQIHYWLRKSAVTVDGEQWVYNTVQQWQEQFPFWSADTVRRTLDSLKKSGLLIAERHGKSRFDRTLYYRIDYAVLATFEDGNLQPSDDCNLQCSEDGNLQSSYIDRDYTETTQRGDVAPEPKSSSVSFDTFWSAYPKKAAKPDAKKAFEKLKADDHLLAAILSAIDRFKATDDWQKNKGQFIPHPASWLNAKRWEDEFDSSTAEVGSAEDHFALAT